MRRPVRAPCTTRGMNNPATPPPPTVDAVASTRMVARAAMIQRPRSGSRANSTDRYPGPRARLWPSNQ